MHGMGLFKPEMGLLKPEMGPVRPGMGLFRPKIGSFRPRIGPLVLTKCFLIHLFFFFDDYGLLKNIWPNQASFRFWMGDTLGLL